MSENCPKFALTQFAIFKLENIMVVKSLVKLIDEAIIPAVALIFGKMAGLFLASYFLKLPFTIENGTFFKFLPTIHFLTPQSYVLAENYANLAMFLVASLGTMLVIVRAHFLHASHIHPRLHARLVSLNLESFVAASYHLYHQAAIWLTFLWLTVAFLAISTLAEITYPQITLVAFIVAANFSWVFGIDIEKEIELTGQKI